MRAANEALLCQRLVLWRWLVSADRNRPSGGSDAPADDLGPSRAVNVAGALPAGFDASFERCGQIARFLDGEDAARLEHSEIESWLEIEGRDLLRAFLQTIRVRAFLVMLLIQFAQTIGGMLWQQLFFFLAVFGLMWWLLRLFKGP